jgi:hypothetical protein
MYSQWINMHGTEKGEESMSKQLTLNRVQQNI